MAGGGNAESIPIVTNLDEENGENDSPIAKRSRKKRSRAWEHFESLKSADKTIIKAKCLHCKDILSGASSSGTSHLLRHISICRKRLNSDIRQFMLSNETSLDGTSTLKNYKFDQDTVRREIGLMVVFDERPFTTVEDTGFRRVMTVACPQFKMIGRMTIKRDVMSMYSKEKENMCELLAKAPGRICLTSDSWQSLVEDHYVCVTAHFINEEWKLQKRIIRFQLLPPPYDGLSIGDIIISYIVHWNIEHKIFSITLDNATVNDVVANNLKARLSAKGFLPCRGSFFQVRCCAHILNLIVQAGMKLIDNVILKLRLGIKYVKQSSMRKKNFKNIAQGFDLDNRKKLCTDCPTRWNATYLMIESAIYYKSVFLHMGRRDSNFTMKLTEEEWEKLIVMHKFLEVFYEVTCLFSGTLYPTANVYFRGVWKVHTSLLEVLRGENNFMTNMVKDMYAKFSKYWSEYSLVLSCAAILDPRYKVKFVAYCFSKLYHEDAEGRVNTIVSTLHKLFDEYMERSASKSLGTSSVCVAGASEANRIDGFEDYETFQSQTFGSQFVKSELDLYLEESCFPLNHEIDVLEYWNKSSMRYPELAKMARDLLAIPVSTVASESTFSTGRRVISPFRSSLKPKTVQALICLQDWMRAQNREGKLPSSSSKLAAETNGVDETHSSSESDTDEDEFQEML